MGDYIVDHWGTESLDHGSISHHRTHRSYRNHRNHWKYRNHRDSKSK